MCYNIFLYPAFSLVEPKKKVRFVCRERFRLRNILLTLKYAGDMKKYICKVCGWVYDPKDGDPDSNIAPGTAFEDIPHDWVCPVCGVGKDDFEPVD